ncbi:MAG: dethiobiotin synthase [Steroidobacteraceae bacterium]|jgi:dethiobiotin synthetase
MSLGLFVTGTDTHVGKTRVATALCHAFAARGLRVAAMKPVASGCTATPAGLRCDDALALRGATNVQVAYGDLNPYAFESPIAPHIAAAAAGGAIDFEVLDLAFERQHNLSDVIVVEGAGGWLVPLDAHRSMADLAVRWNLEVVLVVGLRLGCLNHALLTAESIGSRDVRMRGWIANTIDPDFERRDENILTLQNRIAAPCLGILEYAPQATSESIAQALSSTLFAAA